jgi:hypothetical protein
MLDLINPIWFGVIAGLAIIALVVIFGPPDREEK